MQAQEKERFTSSESLLRAQGRWNNCSNWPKKSDCLATFTRIARISASTRKKKKKIESVQTRFHGETRARKFVFMLAYVCASDLTESQAVI